MRTGLAGSIMFMVLAVAFWAPYAVAGGGKSDRPWQVALTTNYGSWDTSDLDNDGRQTSGYFQLAYDAASWGGALTTQYAASSYKTTQDPDRLDITSLTDTNLSTYYMSQLGRVTLRGGVDLNLPTGKHAYSGAELKKIITDSLGEDLMMVNAYGEGANLIYGEGLNVVPHALVSYRLAERVNVGLGVRYEVTGDYDLTSDTPDDNISPGDRLLTVLTGAFTATQTDYLTLTFKYATSGVDKQKGNDIFQRGDIYTAETRYIKGWTEYMSTVASLAVKWQGKNRAQDQNAVLNNEVNNSNNNSWEFLINNAYAFSDRLSVSGMAGYKSVSANGYSQGETLYDAGRSKAYIEPGVTWYPSDNIYLTLKARYSQVNDKKDSFSSTDATYKVINIDAGVVASF